MRNDEGEVRLFLSGGGFLPAYSSLQSHREKKQLRQEGLCPRKKATLKEVALKKNGPKPMRKKRRLVGTQR